jgi:hypothetical protein
MGNPRYNWYETVYKANPGKAGTASSLQQRGEGPMVGYLVIGSVLCLLALALVAGIGRQAAGGRGGKGARVRLRLAAGVLAAGALLYAVSAEEIRFGLVTLPRQQRELSQLRAQAERDLAGVSPVQHDGLNLSQSVMDEVEGLTLEMKRANTYHSVACLLLFVAFTMGAVLVWRAGAARLYDLVV